jgi:hypothetical protein
MPRLLSFAQLYKNGISKKIIAFLYKLSFDPIPSWYHLGNLCRLCGHKMEWNGISPKMLKIASSVMTEPLSWVINSSILSQTVPKVWKKARATQEKGEVPSKNYRPPVSILPTCSKIMEEVVCVQLNK